MVALWVDERLDEVGFFATTFSRHGRLDASIILLIWLSEKVGGALYLEVGEALGVAHIAIVAGARANVAKAVGHAAVIRLGDEALLGSAVNGQGGLLALAALHQLRGRIGRGDAQSYCIFMSGTDQPEAMERLQILGSTNDGFRIAEQDLTLRGPGDMFGLRQSGEERFRIGDLMRDADLLKKASEVAKSLPPDQAEKLFADGEAFYHTGEAMAAVADVL